MADVLQKSLKELRDQVDTMVEALLRCGDDDLDGAIELEFDDRKFRTNLRSAVRYTIEEYRVHEGQIGANQFNTAALRGQNSEGDIVARTPYDRNEAAWLAAELYVAAAALVARCLGYPDDLMDDHPKEGEWSIRETVEHLIHIERSGEWSLKQHIARARGETVS
jgi:hypothetical protein